MFRYLVQFALLLIIFSIIQLILISDKYSVNSIEPSTISNSEQYSVKLKFVHNITNINKNNLQNLSKNVQHDSKIIKNTFKNTNKSVTVNIIETVKRKKFKIVKREIVNDLLDEENINVNNNSKINTKIIGGRPVKQNEFPSIVAIIVENSLLCGGTLIKSNFIVTAAHCATDDPSDYIIRAGSIYWNKGGFISQVNEIFINSNFNLNSLNNDIQLMKLKPGFGQYLDTELISLAQLPYIPAYQLNKSIVIGWGTLTEKSEKVTNKLRKLNVKIILKKKCMKLLEKKLTASMLCATGSLRGGRDHCFGDSGGPLYCRGKLSGIISWAFECALPKSPGVYTNVYYMRNWIQKILYK